MSDAPEGQEKAMDYEAVDGVSEIARTDRLANRKTGLGTRASKTHYSGWGQSGCPERLSQDELEATYTENGLGARMIDMLPDHMSSTGFTIETEAEGFDAGAFESWVEDMDILGKLNEATTWGRLYGGGAVIAMGPNLEAPFRDGDVPKFIEVADRYMLSRSAGGKEDPTRAMHVPEFYEFSPPEGKARRVHHTRVIPFLGMKVPARIRVAQDGWSPSILERSHSELVNLAQALGYSAEMVHTASLVILKINGLAAALKKGGKEKTDAQAAIRAIMDSSNVLRAFGVDTTDSVEEFSRNFTGLIGILDHFVEAVVRDSDAPKTFLLNGQPAALNAGADGEVLIWDQRAQQARKKKWTPAIVRLCAGKIAELGGGDKWTVKWDDLRPRDRQRDATILATNVQAWNTLNTMGAMDWWEIREMLIESGDIVPREPPEGIEIDPATGMEASAPVPPQLAGAAPEEPGEAAPAEGDPDDPEPAQSPDEPAGDPDDEPAEDPGEQSDDPDDEDERGTGAT